MTMYFKNREEAGRQLAEILFHPYGRSKTVILALGPGGLLVARPIGLRLQIPTFLVASKEVDLPGSHREQVGTVDQVGELVFNSSLTQGQIDDYVGEYHNHIDGEKINAFHEINEMLCKQGFVDQSHLHNMNIILVTDGLKTGVDLDAVEAFLKPVRVGRIIGAVPVASIPAIDRLHILTDEIRVLSAKENYLDTNHYYEENDFPDEDGIMKILEELERNSVVEV